MPFGQNDLDAAEVDLASVWDFEPPGNLKDKHGTNDGTNFGTTDVVGKFGRGRRLVAVSTQHMDFGNGANLAPTTAFTMALWAKWSGAIAANQSLMGKYDTNSKRSYLLTGTPTNALTGIVSKDGSSAGGSLSLMATANNVIVPGTRQLVILTFSITDKTARIYVNNVDKSTGGSKNASAIATFADVSFAFGATHSAGVPTNFLNADVDQGLFWRNRVLSAAARSALWNDGDGRPWYPNPAPDAIAMPSLSFSRIGRGSRRRR